MTNGFGLNFNDIKEEEYDLLPNGKYDVKFDKVEVKETKNSVASGKSNGFYLNIALKVVGEKYNNRVIFDVVNFENPSETAQRIGAERLKRILICAGFEDLNKTMPQHLVGKVVNVLISTQKDEYNPDGKNIVKFYNKSEATNNTETVKDSDKPSWM